MQLTTYTAAEGFLARAQAWLETHETENNLMLGLALRLRQFPERIKAQPYYATVADEQGLAAAALMTPPYRVIAYSDRPEPKEALQVIVEDLAANEWPVPGVLGPSDTARPAAELWTARTGRRFRLATHERVYELRQVHPLPAPPGRLRLATDGDLDLLAGWTQAFFEDVHEQAGLQSDARETTAHRIADRQLHVWDDRGAVSMCATTRPVVHGISVGLVYTPPELRRRGYARAVVAAASQAMLDAGWQFCTLFTDLANPTSNHIYQEIGYRPVCDYDEYDFEA